MRKVHWWIMAALALIGLTLVFGCGGPEQHEGYGAHITIVP